MFDIEAIKDAPKEKCAPYIDVPPQPQETDEGECAHFLARISGYPRPKITWKLNGAVVVSVSSQRIPLISSAQITALYIKVIDVYQGD